MSLQSVNALHALYLLNAAVFVGWQMPSRRVTSFMRANFTLSQASLARRRYWCVVTPALSHRALSHFVANMFSMSAIGNDLLAMLGPARFVALYAVAGVVSNVTWLRVSARSKRDACLGASGAIAALVTTFAFLHPRRMLQLGGGSDGGSSFRVPAVVYAVVFIAYEFMSSIKRSGEDDDDGIAHSAHWSGALVGLCYATYARRRFGRPLPLLAIVQLLRENAYLASRILELMSQR